MNWLQLPESGHWINMDQIIRVERMPDGRVALDNGTGCQSYYTDEDAKFIVRFLDRSTTLAGEPISWFTGVLEPETGEKNRLGAEPRGN